MRARVHALVMTSDLSNFVDDIRRIFRELGREFPSESIATECSPAIDVFETETALSVSVDLPGVEARALRVIAKGDSLLIAGDKIARRGHNDSTYHLVERGFGRFARVVRLGRPCDPSRAQATLAEGELRISVPKIVERRGCGIAIPVHPTTDVQPQ
jgi:HSP20 family protein